METQEYQPQLERRALRKLGLYIFWVAIVSSLLFAVNTGMVFAFTKGLETKLPDLQGIETAKKFALYLLPMMLLYAEWYAWDVLTTRRART